VLRVLASSSAVRESSAEAHIQQARRAWVSHRVREWESAQDCRRPQHLASLQDAPELRLAGLANATSKAPKKGR
jgi:hypothetical protein